MSVDGSSLTQSVHYTVASGSTIVTLLPSYLDTLADGFHALTVTFRDGTSIEEMFVVVDTMESKMPPVRNIYIDDTLVYSNGIVLVADSFFGALADGLFTLRVELADGRVIEEEIGFGDATGENINPFTDIKPSDWFYNDVLYAYRTGLIDGRTATTYAPNDNLTYAEAVKLAACMHQLHTTGSVALTNGNPWYQNYVDYAKSNNIISRDYSWNTQATRAGYIDIFANALPDSALPAINTIANGSIPDVPMTHPSAAATYKLYRAGILQGVDEARNCSPASNIRRSEVAAILTRMMVADERISFSISNDVTQ